MKKKITIPVAIVAVMMFGCAGSSETMDDTTASDATTTMSETQTMAGSATESADNKVDALVVEKEVVVPVATLAIETLPLENTVDVGEMFNDVEDTKAYDALTLAEKSPNLATFVKLAEHADLKKDLERLGEYTLFAPTNEAFAQMPQGKLASLLLPENYALLRRVMQAHVLPSKVGSAQFNGSQRIQMSENSYIPVDVTMNGTNITVGGATIVKGNVEASDGFIHVIDRVILPSSVVTD